MERPRFRRGVTVAVPPEAGSRDGCRRRRPAPDPDRASRPGPRQLRLRGCRRGGPAAEPHWRQLRPQPRPVVRLPRAAIGAAASGPPVPPNPPPLPHPRAPRARATQGQPRAEFVPRAWSSDRVGLRVATTGRLQGQRGARSRLQGSLEVRRSTPPGATDQCRWAGVQRGQSSGAVRPGGRAVLPAKSGRPPPSPNWPGGAARLGHLPGLDRKAPLAPLGAAAGPGPGARDRGHAGSPSGRPARAFPGGRRPAAGRWGRDGSGGSWGADAGAAGGRCRTRGDRRWPARSPIPGHPGPGVIGQAE